MKMTMTEKPHPTLADLEVEIRGLLKYSAFRIVVTDAKDKDPVLLDQDIDDFIDRLTAAARDAFNNAKEFKRNPGDAARLFIGNFVIDFDPYLGIKK